jgi:hypothetical protein
MSRRTESFANVDRGTGSLDDDFASQRDSSMKTADPSVEQVVPDCCITADGSQALVVFIGKVSIKWARLLRPGFRHCFVVVGRHDKWVVYDPMSQCTNVAVLAGPTSAEIAEWYRQFGFTVVGTCVRRQALQPAPWRPFTCVEAVKRVLGIHAPWVVTPWQLYSFLN